MFYSQTFLGRKGPLGTVWCAAHLQHRLKKSHYTSTDIPSTVDRIMCPEVPIALRMSGHLLLGVVRIYSKKVDYLFHDCNIVLIGLSKVFSFTQVNLPEEARQAPVQAITLPETLNLDAMELDIDVSIEGASDNHLRSPEDITLTDQIPIGRDPYVAITFEEDIMMDASPFGSMQMNENLHEPPENDHVSFNDPASDEQMQLPSVSAALKDPGLSNQMGVHGAAEDFENIGPSNWTQVFESNSRENSQDGMEIETMRDAPIEMTGSLEQVLNDEIHTPKQSVPFQQHSDPPTSASNRPQEVPFVHESPQLSVPFQQHSDPPTSASNRPQEVPFVHESPQLVIQPSPHVQQPRQRRKPQRTFFDEKVVLPNRFMKRVLEDCSDLVKKRRKMPCSALGVWKMNNNRRMEQIFNEPSLAGLSANICDMFKRDYMSTKSQWMVPQEVAPEPTVPAYTAPATVAISELNGASPSDPRVGLSPAIERLRHDESNPADNDFPEFGSFSPGYMPSFRRDGMHDSPFSTNSLESEFAPKTGAAGTTNIESLTKTLQSEIYTPRTALEEQSCLGNTGFSSIPEFGYSEGDLYFLEEDDNTPAGSQASQGVDSLSVRTRAVAKYLKSHSPMTSLSEEAQGDLSLNNILEGKTRKICARMFFETLVLKSYELVDVQQEEPYGDITLKLTPTLAKAEL